MPIAPLRTEGVAISLDAEAAHGSVAQQLKKRDRTTQLTSAVLVAVAGVFTVAFLFRVQIASGFQWLSGNRYDQVIDITILEHWFNAIRGLTHWSEVDYYYPAKQSLGYNDGYFLYGLIYSIFRSARLDPYLSAEYVNVVVRFVGFVGFYLAGRRLLSFRPGWAILAAVLFTLSNNAIIQAHHAQLLSVGLAPIMAVLIDGTRRALWAGQRRSILLWGCSAACLYTAWLLTAFYMAWYFAFFCTFMAASYLAMTGRAELHALLRVARQQIVPLGAILVVLLLTALPFLSVYLAKAHETGMHPYRAAQINTLSLPDLMDVGGGNLLFGRIVASIDHAIRPTYPSWTERMTGFPPALLFFFACGLVLLFSTLRVPPLRHATAVRAMAIASVATWVLVFNINGHSLWWFVYEFFPGAKATRVVGRYQLFLVAPVVAIAIVYLSTTASRIAGPVLLVVCALLVAEEINTSPLIALDRLHELARLHAIPSPPAGCEAFFVSAARSEKLLDDPDLEGFFNHNVDAMIIAEMMHLPTLNGASTFQPPNWHLVAPEKSDYLDRVHGYATANHVNHLCSLDLKAMQWSRSPNMNSL